MISGNGKVIKDEVIKCAYMLLQQNDNTNEVSGEIFKEIWKIIAEPNVKPFV